MIGYLLYLSIGALLWLLIATGWSVLLGEASHIWLLGEMSLWLIFSLHFMSVAIGDLVDGGLPAALNHSG